MNVIELEPATTTAVCADVADADPPPFDAVTTARNVDPTSPATTAYDDAVAPAISTHAPPDTSHRRHRYANDIGVDPDHDPLDTDNDCPDCADPDTTGNPVFTGGDGGPSA